MIFHTSFANDINPHLILFRSTDPRVMPKNSTDPQQTTDVQELLQSSEAFNPNVGVTIAPMSDNSHSHRRQPSNISNIHILEQSSFNLLPFKPAIFL